MNKDDAIKRLRSDVLFRKAMSLAKNEKERNRIASMAEDLIKSVYGALEPAFIAMNENPGVNDKLKEELSMNTTLITGSVGSIDT
ncbi:MAG: hypothetical protein WCT13_05495 [Patescibacteria group bacterium]|jgi:hypothetical protein